MNVFECWCNRGYLTVVEFNRGYLIIVEFNRGYLTVVEFNRGYLTVVEFNTGVRDAKLKSFCNPTLSKGQFFV